MVKTIEGKIIDWTLDCGHVVLWEEGGCWDILHDTLKEFEGKQVKITIELLHNRKNVTDDS